MTTTMGRAEIDAAIDRVGRAERMREEAHAARRALAKLRNLAAGTDFGSVWGAHIEQAIAATKPLIAATANQRALAHRMMDAALEDAR